MALITCKECGKTHSSDAKACPHCGHTRKKQVGIFGVLIALIFGAIVFQAVRGPSDPTPQILPEPPRTGSAKARTPAEQAEADKVAAMLAQRFRENKASGTGAPQATDGASNWHYDEDHDAMTGKPARTATTISTNEITFPFPYGGPQRAGLTLRAHPRHGRDAILTFKSAQFNCGIDECRIMARFDDKPAVKFGASKPSDHSSNAVFIRDFARLVREIRGARRLRLEAEFYTAGIRTLEFDIAGLQWEDPVAKAGAKKL